MRNRQDASIGPVHEVSSILQTLLKDGALRTNIPKLSAFSGERTKGEVSFERWSYELQTLRKTYNDSALWEGIQHPLGCAAADTVRNLGPNVPLDTIITKFTIVYGNVKSFDLLMWDFYCADQGEEESIPSFATRIEGLMSQIRYRFPDKLPHLEEQRLLKDCLFHRCKKSIQESVKYCFADPQIDYMHFLEECRKAEDEDKVGQQAKTGTTKAKVAAATVQPTREDELAKQPRYQQHQIDTLVGQVKKLVSAVTTTRVSSKGIMAGGYGRQSQNTWRGGSRGRGLPTQTQPQTTLQSRARNPQSDQGAGHIFKCWQCGEVGHFRHECPTLKEKGLFKGECLKSPDGLEGHSSTVQSTVVKPESTSEEKEAGVLVEQEKLSSADCWARLVGRANEDLIVINGHPVTALLDTGSQITYVSEAFCQAKGFQINPLNQLVETEGT